MAQPQPPAQRSDDPLRRYERDGFLVLRGLIEPALVAKLRDRIEAFAQGAAPLPAGVATMQEPVVLRGDQEVQNAAAGTRKLEGVPLAQDPTIHKIVHHPLLLQTVRRLLGNDLKLLRAAAMMKPPRIGSPKGLHQDAAYYPVEPMEHVAAWIALDPATEQNGCMEVLPGVHKHGYQEHETREYETDVVIRDSSGDEDGLIRLPMAPGDVLLTHCLTPHRSGPNRSDTWRRALILAYMDSKSRYTQDENERPSWVQSLHVSGEGHPGCV